MLYIATVRTELEQVLLEIEQLENRLSVLRQRAAKLRHYLEIAAEYQGATEVLASRPAGGYYSSRTQTGRGGL